MDRKEPPSFDALDDERDSPDYLRQGDAATETIDLNSLFSEDVTASGSFDIRDDIWATTFGKLLQALPIPVLLIEQSHNIVVANQAWKKIATGYEKILGNPFARLFAKRSVALEGESLVKKVFSTRRTATWEALLEIDNDKIWGRFTFRSIRTKDRRFLLVLVEDLSLEKKQVLLDRKYKKELEKRVEDRTEDLRKKNEDLVREIADRRRSEGALKESEERFRAIFESHHAVLLIIDPETGRIEEGSPGACAFYGYDTEELKKKKITEINTLTPEQIFNQMQIAKVQHRRYFDFRHRLASGEVRDVEVCSGPIIVGGRTLLFSVINDVTERKRAEEALRQSEHMLRAILSTSPVGIALTKKRRIEWANEAWGQMFGFGNEHEYLGQDTRMLYPSDEEYDRAGKALYQDIETGKIGETDTKFRRKDGSVFDAHVKMKALDPLDTAKGTISAISDISFRKQAEEALRENEERLSLTLQVSNAGRWEWNIESDEVCLDARFHEMLGYTPGELPNTIQEWLPYHHPGDTPIWMSKAQAYLRGDSPIYESEHRIRSKVGTWKWVFTRGKLVDITTTGASKLFIGMAIDITERKALEQELARARTLLEAVIAQSPIPMAIALADGTISTFNDACKELLGFEDEPQLRRGLDYLHFKQSWKNYDTDGNPVPAEELPLALALQGKATKNREIRVVRKDGSERWEIASGVPIRDEDGNLIAGFVVFPDITDRKRAEEALRTSEVQLSSAVMIAHLGPWEYDVTKDLFTFNDHFYKLFRTTAEQVGGYTMSSAEYARRFVHPDDMSVVGNEIRKSIEATDPDFSQQLEHRIVYADGEIGHISVRIFLVKDEFGRTVRTLGVNQDITERKRSEEALKESEQQYRTLFEDSIDGIYSVLRDGTITDANPSFCELFGYTTDEMIGKDIRELYLDPVDRPRFQEEIEKHGFVKDYEVKFRKRDGTEVDCLLSSSVHFGQEGSITGYRGIVRDLTARRALQRQLVQAQKMEAVGTLAGGIAHDFNNILQVVLGYSELVLADEDLPDRLRNDLGRVLLAGKSGADLVQRLLTFSRKAEAKPLDLDLNQRIRQTHKFLERTIPKMIDIQVILADDLAHIYADPIQMDQLLMNLAVNARDAMPGGGKLVIETAHVVIDEDYARSHLEAKPGRYVLLRVSDTGSGMDKETLGHIFEPFFTTKEAGKGTGLGLAMVYGIVKQHGGHISCYSEPGEGTTFKSYFPAIEVEMDLDVATSGIMPAFGTETILLVDDEEFLRDLGKRILERSGYTVLIAANGKEALNLYKREKGRIPLVILDLIMPEMGGRQCLEELLKIDPKARVLIASGFAANGQTKEALETGARGFIGKPYNMKRMLQSVREVLDSDKN